MAVAKEQIRQIISENNISSVADVYSLLKDSFKDILQELLEAELDATLGYEKTRKGIWLRTISAMDIPRKPSKASMANFRSRCPGTGMGNSNQSLSPNTSVTFPGLRRRSSPCMREGGVPEISMTS